MISFGENKLSVVVLGAGGTGGWLASFLTKASLPEVILVDGDTVEQKNLLRQNFVREDIGRNKAEAIGQRYNFMYASEYLTSEDMLKDILRSLENPVPVIVGAVDNNATRLLVHNVFKDESISDLIWIDGGNAERHGQTYIAIKRRGEVIFPSPLDIDEGLATMGDDQRRPDQISCAEMQESAPQNVTANIQSAVSIFNILNVISKGGLLPWNLYRFDTKTNTVSGELKKDKKDVDSGEIVCYNESTN